MLLSTGNGVDDAVTGIELSPSDDEYNRLLFMLMKSGGRGRAGMKSLSKLFFFAFALEWHRMNMMRISTNAIMPTNVETMNK